MQQHAETIKHTLDATAAFVAVGALADFLPPIAALFSIIWLSFQIYDRLKYGPRRK